MPTLCVQCQLCKRGFKIRAHKCVSDKCVSCGWGWSQWLIRFPNMYNITVLVTQYTYHRDREVQSNKDDDSSEDNHEGNHDKQGLLEQHYRIKLVVDLK